MVTSLLLRIISIYVLRSERLIRDLPIASLRKYLELSVLQYTCTRSVAHPAIEAETSDVSPLTGHLMSSKPFPINPVHKFRLNEDEAFLLPLYHSCILTTYASRLMYIMTIPDHLVNFLP